MIAIPLHSSAILHLVNQFPPSDLGLGRHHRDAADRAQSDGESWSGVDITSAISNVTSMFALIGVAIFWQSLDADSE
jgi:hypothetical protein